MKCRVLPTVELLESRCTPATITLNASTVTYTADVDESNSLTISFFGGGPFTFSDGQNTITAAAPFQGGGMHLACLSHWQTSNSR
jgi:hypothetical protein